MERVVSSTHVNALGASNNIAPSPLSHCTHELLTCSNASLSPAVTSCARVQINLGSFAFLFSEIVQYSHKRVESIPELEKKLSDIGRRVGERWVPSAAL